MAFALMLRMVELEEPRKEAFRMLAGLIEDTRSVEAKRAALQAGIRARGEDPTARVTS